MKIITTNPGDSNFHWFENFPKKIYSDTILQQKGAENLNNNFLKNCYVLLENGEPKVRLALYQNPNLKYNGKQTASIGNYESEADFRLSNALISFATKEAKQLGAQYLIGGMNGSTWDNYRLSTHHDNANFLMEPYHHLYYNEHFQAAEFTIIAKYFSSIDRQLSFNYPTVLQREKELLEEGLTIRKIDLDDYENELKRLYPFVTNAFKTNFLYTKISWTSFRESYLAAKKNIDPEFVLLAKDDRENIVGIFFCIQDFFNKNEKSLIIKTIARAPDQKWRGLGHVIGNRIYQKAVAQNYESIVHAYIKENGTSNQISKKYSGKIYKNYVLYGKEI